MKYLIIIFCISLFLHCSNKENENRFQFNTSAGESGDSSVDIIVDGEKLGEIGFNKNGDITHFVNYPENVVQILNFHEESSFLAARVLRDQSHTTNGISYTFHPEDGSLAGVFNFEDGILRGDGYTYHKSVHAIENFVIYNNRGEIIYKKCLDVMGIPISTVDLRNE